MGRSRYIRKYIDSCGCIDCIGVIAWEYIDYFLTLQKYKENKKTAPSITDARMRRFSLDGLINSMTSKPSWHWTKSGIVQIMVSGLAISAGLFLRNKASQIDAK